MSDYVCLLITVLDGDQLLKCAIKLHIDYFYGEDVLEYPMEKENREKLHAILPAHVKSCGKIVAVEDIFDVVIKKEIRK